METLHRLAGIDQTADPTATPAQPIPEPPPIPEDTDTIDGANDIGRRGSRASLPLNRKPSHKSFKSSKQTNQNGDSKPSPVTAPENYTHFGAHSQQGRGSYESAQSGSDLDDNEFVWGPTHPCFPHPNPHCTPDSNEARDTRVIRVKRDWLQAGDLYPQFANLYPEILDPLITEDDFRFLITNINSRLKATFNPYTTRALLDSLLGAATGFIWDDLGFTGNKKGMKDLETFIENWNKDRSKEGKDVKLIQPRRTGFLALDFVVPDPGIEMAQDDEEQPIEGGIGPAE